MVRQRAIEIALITAMVLLLIPASSANVNYSYELTTTGGTIIAEDDYRSLSPGSGTTNQYSLHVDAMNAVNGSCNHSLVEGEGGDEIGFETNVTYLRDTTGRAPVLINGKAISFMGGAGVTENIGSASSVSNGENATFYDGAIARKLILCCYLHFTNLQYPCVIKPYYTSYKPFALTCLA